MNKKTVIANAVLWAAAIVAAAVVHTPSILTTTLLPVLWACSLLVTRDRPCESADPR